MRPTEFWLAVAVAAVLGGCSDNDGGGNGPSNSSGAAPATGIEAVSAMVASSSETAEPVNIDSMSLTTSETAEPFAL